MTVSTCAGKIEIEWLRHDIAPHPMAERGRVPT
jgi:hypothetical protein